MGSLFNSKKMAILPVNGILPIRHDKMEKYFSIIKQKKQNGKLYIYIYLIILRCIYIPVYDGVTVFSNMCIWIKII